MPDTVLHKMDAVQALLAAAAAAPDVGSGPRSAGLPADGALPAAAAS